MTVSRTINGHPYVSDETAKKVHAAIRQLDYRPNHAARMLTGKHSRSLGLILPDIVDSFFSVISHAVQEVARENNYLVWLAVSDDDSSIEAAQAEMMTHHPVDGILLIPTNSRDKYLKHLVSRSIPIVTIDRPIEVATTDTVGVENRAGARTAVEHLLQHGHKRIICAASNTHLLTIKERIAGYQDSMRQAKLPSLDAIHLTSHSSAKDSLAELFSSQKRPEALFTANNISTTWVVEALKELGVEIGKDIALVGFDDLEFYGLITPPITAINQPAAELGRLAARLLLQRIRGELTESSLRTVLPVSLVVRQSCGCEKAR